MPLDVTTRTPLHVGALYLQLRVHTRAASGEGGGSRHSLRTFSRAFSFSCTSGPSCCLSFDTCAAASYGSPGYGSTH